MAIDPVFNIEESVCIETISEYEGYTIEEAALTYKRRQKLPSSAFCGPNRSYPAHDAKRVRSGLQRLSQFGGKLKAATRLSILRCLIRKAKKMGIDVSKQTLKKGKKKVSESVEESVLDWYLSEVVPSLLAECNECDK